MAGRQVKVKASGGRKLESDWGERHLQQHDRVLLEHKRGIVQNACDIHLVNMVLCASQGAPMMAEKR